MQGNGDSVMSYEDQEKINLFARRNAQYAELKQEVEDKKVYDFRI